MKLASFGSAGSRSGRVLVVQCGQLRPIKEETEEPFSLEVDLASKRAEPILVILLGGGGQNGVCPVTPDAGRYR
jgi:hypothetical protein